MAQCKSCKATIQWVERNNRWVPHDLDGRNHFETCPDADKFRKKQQSEDEACDYKELGNDKKQMKLNDF